MRGRAIKYSAAELEFVKTHCQLSRKELHKQFCITFQRDDVSVDALKGLRLRNGWVTGRSGRFKPGHDGYKGGPDGPNRTSFKKGDVPANTKPLYSERASKDGYIWIKVPEQNPYTGAPTRFIKKNQWIWKQAGRTIPKGHVLGFIDGDRSNCTLENLELWSRAELAVFNKKYGQLQNELKPTARKVVSIKQQAQKLSKRRDTVVDG